MRQIQSGSEHQPAIILGHPLGNPNAREAAVALNECGLLKGVATSFSYSPASIIGRGVSLMPQALRQRVEGELMRRAWLPDEIPRLPRNCVNELLYSAALALVRGGGAWGRRRALADRLYRSFDYNLARSIRKVGREISALYLYEDGAARSFEVSRDLGIRCLYELPVSFHRFNAKLLADEAAAHPEFRDLLSIDEAEWKVERKDREVELADHIFVASKFTARSLEGFAQKQISIVPYGAPIKEFYPGSRHDEFRALFVGRVGPRKGVHYLLEGWTQGGLPRDELELVGVDEFPAGWLKERLRGVNHRPSVPHRELLSVYQGASVLILPSLADGFGLVMLEAMACGVPVIATENTGGADVISDGVEGFVIPIRSSGAIAEKLVWCREHPQELEEMGRAARRRAEQLCWERYRQVFGEAVKALL